MKKRLLAVLLAAVMVTSMVACGDDSGSNTGDTGNDSSNTGDTGNSNTDDTNTDDTSDNTPTGDPVVVKVYGGIWNKLNPESQDEDVPLALAAKAAVEEKYNITIQWSEPDGYTGTNLGAVIVDSYLNGSGAVNILAPEPDAFMTLATGGVLVDTTDIIDTLKLGSLYTDAATWGGRNYGYTYDDVGNVWVLAYSRKFIEDCGMEKTPTDMFMEGRWSYDDVLDYCAELKSKLPEGTYPFGVHYWHWPMMAGPANGGYAAVASDGTINLTDEHFIEATEFYKTLIDRGYAHPIDFEFDADGNQTGDGEQTFWNYPNLGISKDDPKEFVMTRLEDWQFGDLARDTSNDWGITFWPWGSGVTVPADKVGQPDAYKYLDGYHTAVTYWTNMVLLKDASEQTGLSNETLLAISWDYVVGTSPERAMINQAWEAEQRGETPVIGLSAGQPRSFSTDQDIELYDWAHTVFVYDWTWTFDQGGITDVWDYGAQVISGNKSGRAAGEDATAKGYAEMENRGLR